MTRYTPIHDDLIVASRDFEAAKAAAMKAMDEVKITIAKATTREALEAVRTVQREAVRSYSDMLAKARQFSCVRLNHGLDSEDLYGDGYPPLIPIGRYHPMDGYLSGMLAPRRYHEDAGWGVALFRMRCRHRGG